MLTMRFILSTVGTSILTNLINRGNPEEGTWFGETARFSESQTGQINTGNGNGD